MKLEAQPLPVELARQVLDSAAGNRHSWHLVFYHCGVRQLDVEGRRSPLVLQESGGPPAWDLHRTCKRLLEPQAVRIMAEDCQAVLEALRNYATQPVSADMHRRMAKRGSRREEPTRKPYRPAAPQAPQVHQAGDMTPLLEAAGRVWPGFQDKLIAALLSRLTGGPTAPQSAGKPDIDKMLGLENGQLADDLPEAMREML